MKKELTDAEKKIERDIKFEHDQYIEYLKTLSNEDVKREMCIITGEEYIKPEKNFIDYKIRKLVEIIQDYKKHGYEVELLYALLSEMEYEQGIVQNGNIKEYERIKTKYETYADIISHIEGYKIKMIEHKDAMKLKGFVFSN